MSRRSRKTPPAAASTSPRPAPTGASPWPDWLIGAAIFAATFLVYWPALHGDFIWDDAGHITRSDLRSLDGLWRIWFERGETQQYYPLLHSAFWFEHGLWGDAPLGYHVINVLLHATSACLFAVLLRRLTIPGAWLAAAIFALHPVCVETVAWVSEQKNTLSLVFYLCAALAYLRFENDRRGTRYAVATAWFVAALATKTVTATLPAALLVLSWWKLGRLTRREILPLLPWFALSAISGWHTASFEHDYIGAQGAGFSLSLVERCLVAGRNFWFYLSKLFWPADLIFIYPRWNIDATAAWQWIFPLTALALLATLWFARRRGLLAAALLFLGSLFPALGFVNVYPFIFSFVADHFQYLACLAVIATVARGIATIAPSLPAWGTRAGIICLLTLLAGLTWRQSGTYRDVFTLYETTLARNPAAWMAHNNLAKALTDAGRPAEAIPHLGQALKLRPDFPEAENNLGDDLRTLDRAQEALSHFETALRLQPKFAEARNSYGMALMACGRTADGIAQFEQALAGQPHFAVACFNLGLALAQSGRTAEAVAQLEQAVRLQPDFADAELQWAAGLTLLGRFTDAVPHFERALQLQPDSPAYHHDYARALAQAGRWNDAIAHEEEAVALNPNFADAHFNLARLLQQVGRRDEAQQHAAAARQLGK